MTDKLSPTVTPEMIEAGAKAIHAVSAEPEHGDTYEKLSLGWKDNLRTHAFQCYLAMHSLSASGDVERATEAVLQAALNGEERFRPLAETCTRAALTASGNSGAVSDDLRVIPAALFEALGDLVSTCADQRDTYPDDATALEAITETINAIYACVEDGVFGRVERNLNEGERS
jgi:hypothetical protein